MRRPLRAQPQCQRRRKVAAGAVSGDSETLAVCPERTCFRTRPAPRGFDVVERGGIDMLRRQAIVDGHDDCAQPVGENPAKLVMRVERADDPSAAVREQDQRQRCRQFRAVDAHRNGACGTRSVQVADRRHDFRFAAEELRCLFRSGAKLFDARRRGIRRRVEHRVEQAADIGIEHRGVFGYCEPMLPDWRRRS